VTLEALKALLPYYAGRVKCIFIDPPYNTRSALEHYDDNLEHSQWLAMMFPRFQLLRDLLAEDGSIWMSIDDNEPLSQGRYGRDFWAQEPYCKCRLAENLLTKDTARHFSEDHDHILVYAKDGENWRPNELPRPERMNASYRNPDNDPRGPWTSGDVSARNFYGAGTYPITCPSGRVIPDRQWHVLACFQFQKWMRTIVFGGARTETTHPE
jgi:adenine-specific DNA-methyltransferase